MKPDAATIEALPREDLVRAHTDLEWTARSADDTSATSLGTLRGYFAVWGERAEIDSLFEGNFIESFARGAFTKTISENGDNLRLLLDHGWDAQVGRKPLGPFTDIGEDERGAYYEAELLDTAFNRDLLPGLEAGLYGASFRFKVVREDVNLEPEPSDDNPEAIPERVIKEAQLRELGPTAFPTYKGTTANVRSLTDHLLVERLTSSPEARDALVRALTDQPSAGSAEETHPADTPVTPRASLRRSTKRLPNAPQSESRLP